MSIYTIMQNLRRLHDAHGHLTAAWGHMQAFERAANLNRRDPDAWDVFGLQNEQMTQIVRILRRTQRITQQLERATGNAPNRSREMSRLFAEEPAPAALGRWVMRPPMLGDFIAAGDPDMVMCRNVFQETLKGLNAARAA